MPFNLGSTEVIIVLAVLAALFGGKKMAEVARGLGETQKEYKKIKKEYGEAAASVTRDIVEADEPESEEV